MPHRIRIGEWWFTPDLHLLSTGETRVRLEPKGVELLALLARKPGETLTRAQILSEVWGDVVVTDEVLTNAIHQLRKAFGDEARKPRYIETISRRGYRLTATVEDAGSGSVPPAISPRRRVWLPAAALGLGFLVLIGSHLPPGIRTDDAGDSLVARAGIELESGRRGSTDRAARLLEEAARLAPDSPAAWAALSRARRLGGSDDVSLRSAHEAAERALALDPRMPEAHVAIAHVHMSGWRWQPAERHLLRALALDSSSATAHGGYAALLLLTGRPEQAAVEAARSVSAPDTPPSVRLTAGMVHSMIGDGEEAARQFAAILETHPHHEAARRHLVKLSARSTEDVQSADPTQILHRIDDLMRKGEVRPALVAALFAEAGDHSRTAEWLGRALAEKDDTLLLLRFDGRWRRLRDSTLYRDALARAGVVRPAA